MFCVKIPHNDIFISSIEKEDFHNIESWMREQVGECYSITWINVNELKDRFVEYYMSDSEVFLKILKDNKIIGIFKGTLEGDRLIIWCYIIDNDMRSNGIGSSILEIILEYFKQEYGIQCYVTGVVGDNTGSIQFWRKNKFDKFRVSKNFFSNGKRKKDMLLLKRNF